MLLFIYGFNAVGGDITAGGGDSGNICLSAHRRVQESGVSVYVRIHILGVLGFCMTLQWNEKCTLGEAHRVVFSISVEFEASATIEFLKVGVGLMHCVNSINIVGFFCSFKWCETKVYTTLRGNVSFVAGSLWFYTLQVEET
jgi:hypothetical protein